eukprot:TRINITY_DN10178_c0_g1_i1.p2 TRINITY_DN10178_c0_g1~~TRINITY_DN10178_c0_g1_i1.p2  ORF type:complete len:189 (-),score=30.14 TRINITY_DN10178_c0_g1_i1:1232-1798(-)
MENEEHEIIRAAVLKILQESDMTVMTESRVRELASHETGIDLTRKPYKQRVQQLVQDFLASEAVADADEEEGSEDDKISGKTSKELCPQPKKSKPTATFQEVQSPGRKPGENTRMEDGALLVCQLTSKRNVTVADWKGTKLVSIREFYEKDGKTLPGKGISLTRDQWKALKEGFADIDGAIKTIKGGE